MSMNPPAAEPTRTEVAKYAATSFWHKHEEGILALAVFIIGIVTGATLSQ